MSRPFFSVKDVMTGMPGHPEFEDRPLLWLTSGDQWVFRRTTNDLYLKDKNITIPGNPIVRYVVCAIEHPEEKGGGFDWAMWQEIEIKKPDGTMAVVSLNVCVPPSYLENRDLLDKSLKVSMIAFEEVYENPFWISQYEKPTEIRIIENYRKEL